MKPSDRTRRDVPAKLSTLWIFLLINMIYADIFGFMHPGTLTDIMNGGPAGGPKITPMFLLLAAAITEIPIAMVFLSRFLRQGVNRWVNIAGALITIAWVTGMGSAVPSYYFLASIEVLTSLFIIGMAWKWRAPAAERVSVSDGRLVVQTEAGADV
jgi:hypothetical protein